MSLAPIILFTYARPEHTKQTVEALKKNILSNESELFIFSDAAKNEKVMPMVAETRLYLKTIKGFKSVKIFEQNKNYGLAKSIINGVTYIINKYNKAIVLEDDIVTGTHFLEYMNESLEKYENNKKLWHITGWRDPIENTVNNSCFVYPTMDCWGWATWKDRWKYLEKNPKKIEIHFYKKNDI